MAFPPTIIVIVADLAEVMVCGLDSLLQTTLGGECSVAIPVTSTLKILLGLFLKLCFVSKDDNSLKYLFRVSCDAALALDIDNFRGFTNFNSGHLCNMP